MHFIVLLKLKSREFSRRAFVRLLEPQAYSSHTSDSSSVVGKIWLREGSGEACLLVTSITLESVWAHVLELPLVKSGQLEAIRILPLQRQHGQGARA
jgi:hypothetical protein